MNRRPMAADAVLLENRLHVAREIDSRLRRRQSLYRSRLRPDGEPTGIVRAKRCRELQSGVPQIAEHLIAGRLRALPNPGHEIVERPNHFRLAELTVRADAIDALREQPLVPRGDDRALQRLLQEDRDVQIAGA